MFYFIHLFSLILQLDTPVVAKGPVEIWLKILLQMQQKSLHGIIRAAFYHISDPGYQLLSFLNQFPAQVRTGDVNLCVQSGLCLGPGGRQRARGIACMRNFL